MVFFELWLMNVIQVNRASYLNQKYIIEQHIYQFEKNYGRFIR
jgi:hypothetical protein